MDFFSHVDADYGAKAGISLEDDEGEITVPRCQFSLLDENATSANQGLTSCCSKW